MMSLFSSFDLMFFYYSFITMFFFVFFMSCGIFKMQFFKHMIFFLFTFMFDFFSSIKSFKFKNLDLFFFSIMMMLMSFNIFSIFPYFFSITSQISCNLYFSGFIWISLMIFSLFYSSKWMLIHFVPMGTPFFLIWFLFFVELVSNFIRPITLMVRLLANILAGHLLLILLSKVVFIFTPSIFLFLLLNLVEVFVSIIQSYIFVTMLCLYFSDMA